MRVFLLVVLASAPLLGASDPVREWRSSVRRLAREEKTFWGEFGKRWNQAWTAYIQPVLEARGKHDGDPNPLYDYAPFRNWYEDYAAIQRALGEADLDFAKSGHPKAAATLLKELLATDKLIDKLEADLLKARPFKWDTFDQHAPIQRSGLAIREQALIEALGRCADAAVFLADRAWKEAVRKDGRRSIRRRVAVIDALGFTGDSDALAFLSPLTGAKQSSLRVAAAEALLRFSARGRPALRPLVADPSLPVRRALLQGIATQHPQDPGWIPVLVEALPAARGVLIPDILKALKALTNQRFGYDPAAWKSWLEDYRTEIEGGGFDKQSVEVREAKPKPVPAGITFYGIRIPSRSVVFVLDGSRHIWWPAAWEVQKTQYKNDWDRKRATWEKLYPSHQKILLRELGKCFSSMPEDASFSMVRLQGEFVAEPLTGRRLLHAKPNAFKQAEKFVAQLAGDGWCSQFAGLMEASRLAGLGPESELDFPKPLADTIILFDAGDPAGGRYMSPEALVDAFRRFNRFRRLVVHTIRICNEGQPSEVVMKGIAEASGGTYLWASKPPAD